MTGSSRDNPYNSKEGMDNYFAGLDERTRRCREDGEPLGSSGVVYPEFDYAAHVYRFVPHGWKKGNKPPKNYTVRVAIDTHPSTPHAVLFAATAPTGEVFFYAEYFEPVDLEELTKSILDILDGHAPEIVLLEPAAYINNPVDNTTMAQKIEEGGLITVKAPKDLTRGILEVKRALKERIKTPKGAHPRLLFSEELLETLWEFERYMWDPKHANKPLDKDDHMMECLYRLVITGLSYVHITDEEIQMRDGAIFNDRIESDAAKLVYG